MTRILMLALISGCAVDIDEASVASSENGKADSVGPKVNKTINWTPGQDTYTLTPGVALVLPTRQRWPWPNTPGMEDTSWFDVAVADGQNGSLAVLWRERNSKTSFKRFHPADTEQLRALIGLTWYPNEKNQVAIAYHALHFSLCGGAFMTRATAQDRGGPVPALLWNAHVDDKEQNVQWTVMADTSGTTTVVTHNESWDYPDSTCDE